MGIVEIMQLPENYWSQCEGYHSWWINPMDPPRKLNMSKPITAKQNRSIETSLKSYTERNNLHVHRYHIMPGPEDK